jgi:phage-related protein
LSPSIPCQLWVELEISILSGEEPGVQEIRIRTEDAYRIFYVAKFDEAVYVLHAFQKKTQKTSKQDINIGQQRYQQMIQYRESQVQEDNNE